MPSVITMAGHDGGRLMGDMGDHCKWTKKNKRTGCKTRLCHTGEGRSGWQFTGTDCPTKERKKRRRGRKR